MIITAHQMQKKQKLKKKRDFLKAELSYKMIKQNKQGKQLYLTEEKKKKNKKIKKQWMLKFCSKYLLLDIGN